MDVDNYFDTINHDILFNRLQYQIKEPELVRLIELSVKTGIISKKLKWSEIKEGVPQGGVLSPLLANFYLHSFDQFVTSKTKAYIRYADDFLILADKKEEIEELKTKATEFLQKRLLLKLNDPLITETKTGIEFLGIIIKGNKISISEEKKLKLKERIHSIDWENGKLTKKSMESIDGIKRYYSRLLPQEYLTPLDKELIDKITSMIKSGYQSIPNKKTLNDYLKIIPAFSTQIELNRKNQINEWCDLYLELKKTNQTKRDTSDNEENTKKNRLLINSKKREYQKREGEGSELVISTPGSFIGKSNKGISVKINGKNIKNNPSNALGHITVVTRGASISSDAIQFCMNNNIPVDFFDGSGKLYASILSPVFVDQSLWHKQVTLSTKQRAYLASKIVEGKLKNQFNLVKYFHKYHKDDTELIKRFDDVKARLDDLIKKTKTIDSSNEKYAEVLMSYEAAGASAYWSYIRQLIADDGIDFESRERKGASDLFNSLLNYGYALLYSRVWQAVLSARLNPSLSVLHVQQPGKPTLVFDLVELFRAQAVDRVVISLVQKGEPLSQDKYLLSETTKKLLIQNIFERLNRYEKYRSEEMKFLRIFKEQAREMADYISGDRNSFKPYIAKW